MKLITQFAMISFLFTACQKTMTPGPEQPVMYKDIDGPVPIKTPIIRIGEVCIDSYDDLMMVTGNRRELTVTKVLLEDGSIFENGNLISQMVFHAVEGQEEGSIFRSQLYIYHTVFGFTQSVSSDVWTLGCKLRDRADGPLTNLVIGGVVIRINTCFVWSVPLAESNGKRITYLYVK